MTFEDVVKLHTALEVWYVVDGYMAVIVDEAGKVLHEGRVEPTVLRAIGVLGQQLQGIAK